ncbi:hypothetical protein F4604DRAFT_1680990 [Suillus subluteus]|nr:hypothetical protein F4604DRAFT_1680990 [Suillus subluteus]
MPNQNKPTPPLDEIAPHILRLWKALPDRSADCPGIAKTHRHDSLWYRFERQWVFNIPVNSVTQSKPFVMRMLDLRATYPNAGAREMRKACRLRRRRFWAAGVNDLFAVDQHDKWLRFSLGLHTGIEPFSGYMPMVTQIDPGSENYGIANAHTMLRQCHNKALHGTLQHRWMRTKKNVMPEIAWSQLRRRFTPGFENLLDHGVNSGWYDSNNTLQVMIFHWVFIPWLQQELDAYQDRINNTAKRRDRNKILPHGVPNLIYHSAEDFGALDFKIQIEPEALDFVRSLYIKPSHCVFDLVPEGFGKCIQHCYNDLGRPVITRQSVWDTYRLLLDALQLADELPGEIQLQDDEDEDFVPLLDDHQDLPSHEDPNGAYYMGGVGGGLGLDVLSHSDEPDITAGIDESSVGLDHAGLVVWEFSDCESDDEMVDGW